MRETHVSSTKMSEETTTCLLLLVLGITAADLEVAELVRVLVVGDDVQEIAELLLLQVLLGQVLDVALGERKLSSDVNLGLVAGHSDLAAELASLAVDLDLVVQELLESGRVEDLVLNGLPAVDGELGNALLGGLLNNRLL